MSREQNVIKVLDQMFPDAHVELNHNNHFELLVAVMLSAQTTDVAVNKVTPQLFSKYPTPELMAQASKEDIEPYIKTIGLYRNKAKHLVELSKSLVEKHQSIVPSRRDDLEALPGVGRKTANVVLSNAFGIPAFAVDTHVARVSVRLGLAKEKDSLFEIEKKLMKKFPKDMWLKLHHQLIFFGRYHCLAVKPKCYACSLYDLCKFRKKEVFKANE